VKFHSALNFHGLLFSYWMTAIVRRAKNIGVWVPLNLNFSIDNISLHDVPFAAWLASQQMEHIAIRQPLKPGAISFILQEFCNFLHVG